MLAVHVLDTVVLITYLAGMLVIGWKFAARNSTTEEYFVGRRSFAGWVLGLSMFGTSISSITFLAFPGQAFAEDWRQLVTNVVLPLAAIPATIFILPMFRRGQLTSAYEYLGARYGTWARIYGTLSFTILQLLRLATVLYLVALPVQLLAGLPNESRDAVIIGVGLVVGLYTVLGGISAVIWTDVVQTLVLWLGGAACFAVILLKLPGGWSQLVEVAAADHKFGLGDFDFDLARQTFWTAMMLGLFNYAGYMTCDQNVVQRFVAAESLGAARRAMLLYTLTAVPTWIFFYLVGTSVYSFYQVAPDPALATLQADQVFPHFILTQMPDGISGLVIAGVLAAAMSSLDSSINAISTILTVDIVRPHLLPHRDDRTYLRIAQGISIATGVLMIAGAMVIGRLGQATTNGLNWLFISLFGGCLVGLFLTGLLTTRVGSRAAGIAVLCAVMFNVYLGAAEAKLLPAEWRPPIHGFWTGVLVNLLFVTVAYGLSWLTAPPSAAQLAGRTVWTQDPADSASQLRQDGLAR